MNRAVGKRPLFEDATDIRSFETCVAASVVRGELRLQSFSMITTHFHLLVESRGSLANALRRIESEYVQRFNLRHGRDGPLVRGRFCSKLVDNLGYWTNLVRYIDQNPVEAGLVTTPSDYPHGSAYHFAQAFGPSWLDRLPVERYVCAMKGGRPYSAANYAEMFRAVPNGIPSTLLVRRVLLGDRCEDSFRDLLSAADEDARRWLVERAKLADGMRPGLPVADALSVLGEVDRSVALISGRRLGGRGRPYLAREVMSAGLLRHLCAETLEKIARRLERSVAVVRNMLGVHAAELVRDVGYAEVAHGIVQAVLAPWRVDASPEVIAELERRLIVQPTDVAPTPICGLRAKAQM